ncbi:MAG: mandelate racemase/muconate lactonizing enzyme family protein [Candidatus Latescibacteria bacterium]|nr:mandelate racemase/muconate lactonizing enzyme family protein [Candidatus Latescibacterota bacterium]
MKIAKVETFPVRIPGQAYMGGHGTDKNAGQMGNYVTHTHYRSSYNLFTESLLVRITTDDGIEGWGEPQSALVAHIVGQLVSELVAPALIGQDPFDRVYLRDRIYNFTRDRGHDAGFMVDAVSACDIALWDIVGKATNKPIYKLLGGTYHKDLPCYVSGVPAETTEEQIEKIRGWVSKGFTRIKLALGFGVQQDAETIRKVREAFGDTIELFVDAHWAYTTDEAVALARHFEKYNVGFMECAINAEDIYSQAALPSAVDIPIALGEEYRTRYHFKERILQRAFDLAQPDIGRLGITEGHRVVNLCDAFGLAVAPHIGAGLAVYTAATLHVAAASPNLRVVEYQPTQMAISEQYFTPSIQPVAGAYAIPQTPGLGVEPNLEKLAPYIVQ